MHLFEQGSEAYKSAFELLIRCWHRDESLFWTGIDNYLAEFPRTASAVDWGAGTGRITQKLCERFDVVYAIEPSEAMYKELTKNAPQASAIKGTMADVNLPRAVDVGIVSHVYYHIPDHEWGTYTLRCLEQLSVNGKLFVVLKHPDSGCNQMLEAFGAPRFNLFSILDVLGQYPQFTIKFQAIPGSLRTATLADTMAIAHFMLSDRAADAYSGLPSKQTFEHYVREHFWDESRSAGGWDLKEILAIIEHNPLM